MADKAIGFSKETNYREEPASPAAITDMMDFITENVKPSREFIKVQTVNARTPRFSIPGPFKSAGDVEFLANVDDLTWLFGMLLGAADLGPTIQDATTAYKTTWNAFPNDVINSYLMEIIKNIDAKGKLGMGTAMKSLTIDCPLNDKLGVTASLMCAKEFYQTADSIATLTSLKPLVYHQNTVSLFGSAAPWVESISITFENGFDEDAFVQGDMFMPELIIGDFGVTGSLDLRAKDWDAYSRFFGGASKSSPDTVVDEFAIEILVTGANISGAFDEYLKITLNNCHFTELELPTEQRNRQIYTLPFEALFVGSTVGTIEIMSTIDALIA